jgi:heme ABC exporter ATP-binding subunit CcmA
MKSTESPSAAVRAVGLGKRFGAQWALAHCDLVVEPGEAVLLAGANGSGKTTLLRLIAGLYKPTQGALTLFGHDPNKERLTCREQLTLIGHDHYLYSQLTALETVQVWARLSGHRHTTEQLLGLLDEVELRHRSHRRVGGFSAGMKKRLTLLRTRLEEPRLVLLDEPFSALDTAGQKLVEDWVQGFVDQGKTVVVASHNLPRAARLCQRSVYLKEGQVIWQGEATEMVQQMGLAS